MRRCILLAGYSSQSTIDEADTFHVKKLSEIGEVYCCFDNDDDNGHLTSQLETAGAKKSLFIKHGEFDFGSWKRLIDHLGWPALEQYDEVIFVNNSMLLLGELLPFLCEFEEGPAVFFAPALIDEHYTGPSLHFSDYLERVNPFHNNTMFLSSFWAMKAELVKSPFVRDFFHSVTQLESRLDVSYKYEMGFTRSLLRRKISFHLFVDLVYPNSFVYTTTAFGLVSKGFPYLKRKALTAQYYPIDMIYARVEGLKRRISQEYATHLAAAAKAANVPKLPTTIEGTSDFLDEDWYLEAHADVRAAGFTAKHHYERYGKAEGRAPNRSVTLWREMHEWAPVPSDKLDEKWYLANNKDVRDAGLKARRHYDKFGKAEGRPPNPKAAEWQNRLARVGRQRVEKELEFDASWYLRTYSDIHLAGLNPYEHFINFGWREGRKANGYLDLPRSILDLQHHSGSLETILASMLTDREEEYSESQRHLASRHGKAKKLAIFFNVARDLVGGGMLSINRFVRNSGYLEPETGYQTAVSGVPLGRMAVAYSKFEAALPQIEFRYLAELDEVQDVVLFIPEVFAAQFAHDLSPLERSWLLSRSSLRIVVMNQNNDYLPAPEVLQRALFPLTLDVTITTAHKRYCTARNASRYQIPFTQLTPFLPAMEQRSFSQKDRIFMLSPDTIPSGHHGVTREEVVEALTAKLPGFKFVTVENLSLSQYLDLASRAMFSLTFGEGMDGYYIEPILSGGMSFAVYNSTFFPDHFQNKCGVFASWKTLLDRLPELVNELLVKDRYDRESDNLNEALRTEYSDQISLDDLRRVLNFEVDQPPTQWRENDDNFSHIRDHLSTLDGFKFYRFEDRLVCSLPDGNVLRHYGGEFYSVIFEIYVRKDYDIDLPADEEFVLIDVGASFSLATSYLLTKHANIVKAYAYEPAEPTARCARENLVGNKLSARVELRQVGLSDSYSKIDLAYIPDWSTAFSTDDNVLLPHLLQTSSHIGSDHPVLEVEVVPASDEFREIFATHPDKHFILKCDTQGSEFKMIADLAKYGLLDRLDAIVMETHFREPEDLFSILSQHGFKFEYRLDSAENQVYTIRAWRRDGFFNSPLATF